MLHKILLAALLLAPLQLLAQSGENAPARTATEEVTADDESAPDPVGEGSGRDEDSPFDYEASEEISEDLSVSFPVDI